MRIVEIRPVMRRFGFARRGLLRSGRRCPALGTRLAAGSEPVFMRDPEEPRHFVPGSSSARRRKMSPNSTSSAWGGRLTSRRVGRRVSRSNPEMTASPDPNSAPISHTMPDSYRPGRGDQGSRLDRKKRSHSAPEIVMITRRWRKSRPSRTRGVNRTDRPRFRPPGEPRRRRRRVGAIIVMPRVGCGDESDRNASPQVR